MRDRAPISKMARSVPPPELRRFADPSRPGHDGQDLGVNVFADRAAWLAARREWERANKISLPDWFDDMMAETREAAAALSEFNWATSLYMIEDDDWADPRLAAA